MKKIFFFLLPVLATGSVMAQEPPEDISQYSRHYLETSGSKAAIFTGKIESLIYRGTQSIYLRPRSSVQNLYDENEFLRPILPAMTFGEGRLIYDGILYDGVMMRLDLVRNTLSVLSPETNTAIMLEADRLQRADLHGYGVVSISNSKQLPDGYYLELYGGEHRVLKKERYYFNDSERRFTNRYLDWYIFKDGEYHKVSRSKSSVLKVLKKHKRELDRYVRENGIDVRNNMEDAVVSLVAEYERLEQK